MKRLLLFALVPATVVLTACSSMSGMGSPTTGGVASGSSSAVSSGHEMMHGEEVNAADVMFAQMMIPHHEQAVEMSTLAETRASDPQILALAAQISSAQQPEIEKMTAWLQAWGSSVMDQDAVMGMGHGMQGILSDAQLAELKAATGSEFDRLFATEMIAHHEGAIEMAKQVENSANSEVSALAKNIIASQTAEIAQLKAFLAK
jgi:uncharacterized protein (DUF305 family)